jgi:2-phospho-L-lactate/phosphoenolpyruvate guanylyltransferase
VRTVAILPVKSFARAKQRLGVSVADPMRQDLAAAMVADVIAALAQTGAVERTIVVTREAGIAEAALAAGVLLVEDAGEEGQSAAARLGIERALNEGFERVLCVPGDCPAADPAELAALLDGHARNGPEVVIVPDRHGTGTNGLLLHPPRAIEPSFGPDSCARHLELAGAAGLTARIEQVPSLLLDIDTGADLAVLRRRLGEEGERARCTRAVLAGPGFADPLVTSNLA